MKKKGYIFVAIFIILVAVYIARGFLSKEIVTETLRRGTMENAVSTKGMVIKYEDLYSPDVAGILDAKFATGDRVSAGALIAVIYKGSVNTDIKNRLEQITRKIEIIENNQAKNSSFTNDISKLEQEISSNVAEIINSSYNKKMMNVASLKYKISALAERKAAVEGKTIAKSTTLDSLKQLKAEIETQIGVAQSSIYARSAGVFSSYIDNVEEIITPYNMTELTPSKFDELETFDENNIKKQNKADNKYACKIINNYRYFVAFKIDEEKLSNITAGNLARLRFYDLSTSSTEAQVFYVTPPEDGQCVVIMECNRYQEGLLEKRFVNLDFIKESNSGFKINIKALQTRDGVNGVYVERENSHEFIPVNILYSYQDIALVNSTDAKNPLKLYDEVAIGTIGYEDK